MLAISSVVVVAEVDNGTGGSGWQELVVMVEMVRSKD